MSEEEREFLNQQADAKSIICTRAISRMIGVIISVVAILLTIILSFSFT